MRTRPLLGLLLTASLAACASSGTETEPQAQAEPEVLPVEAEPEPPQAPPSTGPSNEPAKTYVQQWATPSGQPSASIRAVVEGRALVIAGPYMEFGTPATHLVSFSLAEGKLEWDYEAKEPIAISGASTKLVEIVVDGPPMTIDLSTGKKITPKKAQSDAVKPIPRPEAPDCEVADASLDCKAWKVDEAGAISILTRAGDSICYAVAGPREIRCRDQASGNLELVISVPAVPEVKHPEAVNFDYERVDDQIIVANYDGMVLAFGPG